MKNLHMKKHTRTDLLTYLGVIVAFVVMNALSASCLSCCINSSDTSLISFVA